ncbi:MAG: putative toxin-antitoxin system toxin component, PIN family [Candidatus Kerfeldbacteria bacterium]|nr:putative toxin-antitoxin system toxin component, PIN family [Candidatus Kerfeldbacteria bacterium]
MRVLLDTNIFVSYLLGKSQKSSIVSIVEAGVSQAYTILLPEELMEELQKSIRQKDVLRKSIPLSLLDEFLLILTDASEILPTLSESIPSVTRDPKDDYLLAYAVAYQADVLVSGDQDLLRVKRDIEKTSTLQILSPREFLRFL